MKKNKIKHSSGMYFFKDRSIKSRGEDILGRARFSDAISDSICAWSGEDSLVLGVYGKWGVGKSSLKNMVVEGTLTLNKVDVVEFNPWQFSGQHELFEAFFQEIGIALGRTKSDKKTRQLVRKWRFYSQALKVGKAITDPVKWGVIAILLGVGIFFTGTSFLVEERFREISSLIGFTITIIAALLTWFSSFAKLVSECLESKLDVDEKSADEFKKEVINCLQGRERPLLIVIDDVDRLMPEEVRLLFQLIKVNADLPKMIYLILADREVIEKSLDNNGKSSGRDFLEKIVQVSFDVPMIERKRLEDVLFNSMEDILTSHDLLGNFDDDRWNSLYLSGLKDYFQSLRQVHRYLSSFEFHVGLFKNDGSFEVNIIDLIALEALRIFEPNIYRKLPQFKKLLVEKHQSMLRNGSQLENAKGVMNRLIELTDIEKRQNVEYLLKNLFPFTQIFFSESLHQPDYDNTWDADLRVCSRGIFDRYFCFAVPAGEISQVDIDYVINSMKEKQKFISALASMKERGVLAQVLERLDTHKERIDHKNALPVVSGLFDIGEWLTEEKEGLFGITSDVHASRIIYGLLKREKSIQKRESVLRQALEDTLGLYLPVYKISLETDRSDKVQNENLISKGSFEDFKAIGLKKIREAANVKKLNKHKKFAYILYRWREWGGKQEVMSWTSELITTPEGALDFIQGILGKSTSVGGRYGSRVREHWYIQLKTLEDFVSLEQLKKSLKDAPAENLNLKQKRAVRAFESALKRRAEGKPDDRWADDG